MSRSALITIMSVHLSVCVCVCVKLGVETGLCLCRAVHVVTSMGVK